jgi:hypothetical protein
MADLDSSVLSLWGRASSRWWWRSRPTKAIHSWAFTTTTSPLFTMVGNGIDHSDVGSLPFFRLPSFAASCVVVSVFFFFFFLSSGILCDGLNIRSRRRTVC